MSSPVRSAAGHAPGASVYQLLDPITEVRGFLAAELELEEALRRDLVLFGDDLLPTYPVPFTVPTGRLASWISQTERLAAGMERLAHNIRADDALFARFRLRREARRLLEIDPGYQRLTPLSRPDALVMPDGSLVFVEFNCDSPAMMAFADLVSDYLLDSSALRPWRTRLIPEDRTPRLLQTLLDCYAEYGGSASPPHIAITDWEGQKTRHEHNRIAERFNATGFPSVVCDPREFRRVGGQLLVDGRPIHIVYRRALFHELLERESEVEQLLSAYRDGKVCMVNSLRSYLASSKTLLSLMSEEFPSLVAGTRIASDDLPSLADARGRWVLKKGESHGGQDVLLPDLVDAGQWEAARARAKEEPWVLQQYCPVPKVGLRAVEGGELVRQEKFFNWNPFLFGGRYSGAIARASDTPLINITRGGALLPTMELRS